jgi:hypothetical protein
MKFSTELCEIEEVRDGEMVYYEDEDVRGQGKQ